jgi:hypothetical protein
VDPDKVEAAAPAGKPVTTTPAAATKPATTTPAATPKKK